jgi:PAS domain S-box-containing protein
LEKRYVRKDGKIAWVNVNVSVIRDVTGQPVRTMATVEDITERRQAEEERTQLTTALGQAAESIVITDISGLILYVNPAFERITGYSRREAIGQNPRFLQSGQHDAAFYKQLWATLERGEVWHGHLINRRKDGAIFEEDATISPVRDAAGKVVNYMAIKLDVTREMELESQFRQSQKLEAIGQLAGGVAHDFNNILTSILMQVELAGFETGLSSDLLEGLQQIESDANRAAALTRQLLLFSRRQVMQSRDLDLNEIVTNLAKMLQRIIGEDVHLQLHLHPVPLLTHADPGMLDQVAMNLSVNARDAMPEGGRLLIATSEKMVDEELARQHPEAAPGRYVCLSVTDAGCGIPAELLPKIFEPFFTTKEPGKGTGLGLATVFGIVKQHRGWLTVDSEVGQGATFKIFLPALAAVTAPAAAAARPKPRGGTETILLTEDDPAVRKSTATILKHQGYRVLEAASGSEALKLWHEHRGAIALLFTDLVMPGGVSGRQLAQQLQAGQPDLKVIFASGYSAEIAGREIQLQAGENFMQKPFRPDDMLKTIRSCLDV